MLKQHHLSLLLALLAGQVASRSADHSDRVPRVYSSLQNSAPTSAVYPEGIELELTCQATARATFWYERHPPDAYPDAVKDKLISSIPTTAPGVFRSVFTLPLLNRTDDGRELWCTMDGSSSRSVVNLKVVGLSDVSVTTLRNASSDGYELLCSSDSLHPELELCWYRGKNLLRCQGPHGGPASATVRVYCPDAGKQEGEAAFLCEPRLKDRNAKDSLKKKARDRFKEMFNNSAKKVNPTDKHCREILKPPNSSTLHQTSTTVLKPTDETEINKTINPSNETTTTTTIQSLSTTSTPSTISALPAALLPSTAVTTVTRQPSVTPRSTTKSNPWTPTHTQTLLMITAALLLGLFFTSVTSVILVVKLRQTRTSVQTVYNDSQGAPNGNQSGSAPSGDGRGHVGNIPRPDGRRDGISHSHVRVNDLESGQEYPGALDTSEHRWPGEGVPLDHAYYYPDITEQVKEEILNGNLQLSSRISRGGADRTGDSTTPLNAINHSYHYPVLCEEMKRLLSTSSEQGSRLTTEGGGASQ